MEAKLQRATTAYLGEALPLDEYRDLRNRLTVEKQDLRQKLADLEHDPLNWLEPTKRFVKALQRATYQLSHGSDAERAETLKNTGSNLTIKEKRLHVSWRGAWELVGNPGRFAHQSTAAPLRGAAAGGETGHDFTLAEYVGRRSNLLQGQPAVAMSV